MIGPLPDGLLDPAELAELRADTARSLAERCQIVRKSSAPTATGGRAVTRTPVQRRTTDENGDTVLYAIGGDEWIRSSRTLLSRPVEVVAGGKVVGSADWRIRLEWGIEVRETDQIRFEDGATFEVMGSNTGRSDATGVVVFARRTQ